VKAIQSKILQIAGLVAVLLASSASMQGSDWRVGDIFVAVGNGQYKVYGSDGTFKETISDGLGGITRSCAIDSTYHLLTTNYTNTKVVRRAIGHPHDSIGTFAGNEISLNSDSIVFDGAGNFYVGNAGGTHATVKYNPDGTISTAFPIAGDQGNKNACGWIDLSADGNTLFYTCEGRSVKRYNVGASPSQLINFATFSGSTHLYALRVLPSSVGGGLLVAAEDEIWLLNSAGAIIRRYDVPGEDNWQVLALDPLPSHRFWAGNPTTQNVYEFDMNDATWWVGPIPVGSGVTGLCSYGGFSAAQPAPSVSTSTATSSTSTPPTYTFAFPGRNDNNLTLTLNGDAVDPNTMVTAGVTVIDPAAGTSDPSSGSLPCTRTANGGTNCVVWHLEADPDLAPNPDPDNPRVTADIKLESLDNFQDANTRVLRNEAEDITTATGNIDGVGNTRRWSVYSLNQTSGFNGGCYYSSPLQSDSTFNSGRTIPVKIQCDPTAVPDMSQFVWHLNILQKRPPAVPAIVTFQFTGGTPNEPKNHYRCSSSQCVINLDTSSVAAAKFILATFATPGPGLPPSTVPPQSFNTEVDITK
jgi:hypothetical protein